MSTANRLPRVTATEHRLLEFELSKDDEEMLASVTVTDGDYVPPHLEREPEPTPRDIRKLATAINSLRRHLLMMEQVLGDLEERRTQAQILATERVQAMFARVRTGGRT